MTTADLPDRTRYSDILGLAAEAVKRRPDIPPALSTALSKTLGVHPGRC